MCCQVLEERCHALLERDVTIACPAKTAHLGVRDEFEDFFGATPGVESF